MSELDKLKEYKIYLSDDEIKALEGIRIDCNTFEGTVLAGIVHQVLGFYEEVE